jgi:CheY-like chemotaxis protein
MTKILIVEDTATFRAILRHQLIGLGITSLWMATDGEEALGMLWQQPDFDLILCDWHMHPMDGLTFCSKVRTIPTLQERAIPVLFMTADAKLANPVTRERILEHARGLGIVEILPKPFETDELKTTLERCLGHALS